MIAKLPRRREATVHSGKLEIIYPSYIQPLEILPMCSYFSILLRRQSPENISNSETNLTRLDYATYLKFFVCCRRKSGAVQVQISKTGHDHEG